MAKKVNPKSELEKQIFERVAIVHGDKKSFCKVLNIDTTYLAKKMHWLNKRVLAYNALLSSLSLELRLVSKDDKNVLGLTDDEQKEMIALVKKIKQ